MGLRVGLPLLHGGAFILSRHLYIILAGIPVQPFRKITQLLHSALELPHQLMILLPFFDYLLFGRFCIVFIHLAQIGQLVAKYLLIGFMQLSTFGQILSSKHSLFRGIEYILIELLSDHLYYGFALLQLHGVLEHLQVHISAMFGGLKLINCVHELFILREARLNYVIYLQYIFVYVYLIILLRNCCRYRYR